MKHWRDEEILYYSPPYREFAPPTLDLPSVTLICADCCNVGRVVSSLERCKSLANFGAVKLLTSLETDYPHKVEIGHLPSHVDYSLFCLKHLHEHVDTPHMLVVQHDAWVLNPASWDSAWLSLDYIGSLFIHRHVVGAHSVGSGGFSLRSTAMMAWISSLIPPWDKTPAGTQTLQSMIGCFEDGFISHYARAGAEARGFKYASPEVASKFSQGGQLDNAYHIERPFGFHGLWPCIDKESGLVGKWPPYGTHGYAKD